MPTCCLYVMHKLDVRNGLVMHTIRYVGTNVLGRMRIYQVCWCMLNKIRFQYVTNTLQYVGIHCHMTKWSKNLVPFYTFDISSMYALCKLCIR